MHSCSNPSSSPNSRMLFKGTTGRSHAPPHISSVSPRASASCSFHRRPLLATTLWCA
jgi:hypothetical protein